MLTKDQKMPVFFHPEQLTFKPKYEWALGNRIKHPETTRRAEKIFSTLKKDKDRFGIIHPEKFPLKEIRDTHSYELLTLYNTASTLAEGVEFYPSVFPTSDKHLADPTNIYHAGHYCFDSGTPLNNKTWTAAAWSASCALNAANHILKGQAPVAYALSRPPGHHASKESYGGYCYFNNAAIAAKRMRKKGRVVVLDVDFHHGNGTQSLFYSDDKVLTISVHGDPREYFPYYLGFQTERGKGKGEGFNLNFILPAETKINAYMKNLKRHVIPAIKSFEPDYLIIAAGLDTYEKDPIGKFMLKTPDYFTMSKSLAALTG